MKRREFLRYLHEHGCSLLREGKQHSIYWNPSQRKTSSIPRHSEIDDFLQEKFAVIWEFLNFKMRKPFVTLFICMALEESRFGRIKKKQSFFIFPKDLGFMLAYNLRF